MSSAKRIHVFSIITGVLGLGLVAASLWFFVQVYELTSLRNINHYVLDFKVYWPQAVPWMFFVAGAVVAGVSLFGCAGAIKRSKTVVVSYGIGMIVAAVLLLGVAIAALVFADTQATNDFIKDTVWDVFGQSKDSDDVATAFGNIERKLHCCGAYGPRDYISWKNGQEFPQSCCDTYYHGFIGQPYLDCDFTNKMANERHGCNEVASQYARIVIKVLSAVSVLTAVIALVSIFAAWSMTKNWSKKTKVLKVRHETESEKGLI